MDKRQFKEKKFWDKFAGNYDFFIKNTLDKTYKKILTNIDAELDENKSVLEIGTGTGIIAFSICSKVATIVATDISNEMIQIARRKQKDSNVTNIDFQVQDSYHLTFPDKSFDIVIASNMLHLLYEPEKAIKELERVMKDNGIFIAPTLCVGENTKSKMIASAIGFLSGFKLVNKWSFQDFKSMLTHNGLVIDKALRIEGKLLTAYIVMKKEIKMIEEIK